MVDETCSAIRTVILDDHAVFREGLGGLLSRAGFDIVAEASDAAQCLSVVALHEPDLCVIDYRLGGGETCVELVGVLHERHPDVALAVLTTYAYGAAARDVVGAGAGGFIIKDIEPDDLVRQLRTIAQGGVVIDPRVGARAMRSPALELTTQERAVIQHVAQGLTNREIAETLSLSPHTVKEYLANATRKLGARTRSEAVALALRDELISPP